jgi:hypothetical protein
MEDDVEEKFTSQSDKRYMILEPYQAAVNNSMLWALHLRTQTEDKKIIELEIQFSHTLPKLWINPTHTIGPLRPDIVEEALRKFKGMLFYDEINNKVITKLLESKSQDKTNEMMLIIDDFKISRTTPAQLEFVGYPNLNAEIHNKASSEICRVLYTRYGEEIRNTSIMQEIWFSTDIIHRALNDLKQQNLIDQPSPQTSILTTNGKVYYESNVSKLTGQSNRVVSKAASRAPETQWDVFICHASEDKTEVAIPIYDELTKKGYKVWLDTITLKLGDSLRHEIEEGLKNSRYGMVILSPNFFAKKWPQDELDGLFTLEQDGKKRILPVWHNINFEDVREYSPILAGRIAVKTADGVDVVTKRIIEVLTEENNHVPSRFRIEK